MEDIKKEEGVRDEMVDFWVEASQGATLFEMMHDTDAEELTKHELPEILSYLPSLVGKDVVELGAGIGRVTCELAARAKSVIAVDFIEKYINKNRELNAKYTNIHFMCADVTQLNMTCNSCDFVFSNWLMMYLGDDEIANFIEKQLSWIREGGYMFARESCLKPAGNRHVTKNPTKFRDALKYTTMFTIPTVLSETEENVFGFELVLTRPLESYIKIRYMHVASQLEGGSVVQRI